MLDFDTLLAMTDEEKLTYLHEEVEKILSEANPKQVLKLRALQAKLDGIRSKIKNRFVAADMIYNLMMESFADLNEELQMYKYLSEE